MLCHELQTRETDGLGELLNLQSLEYRRLVADLTLTYKIIFGLIDIDLNVYFRLKGPENARIHGNPYKIAVNQCRLNVRKNFFSERVAIAWNSLPPSVVNFKFLRTFRRTIVNANLKLFTKYYEGRSINKLQNSSILLVVQI